MDPVEREIEIQRVNLKEIFENMYSDAWCWVQLAESLEFKFS